MSDEIQSIQNAIHDLAVIKKAMLRTSAGNGPNHAKAVSTHKLILIASFLFTLVFIGFELATQQTITDFMMSSQNNPDIKIMGLMQVALLLPTVLLCLYFILWRAARKVDEPLTEFLAKHFKFLYSLGFVSDLAIKFVCLSLIVMSLHPEWVAPLLSLFIADFLIQGRLFNIGFRTALVLSLVCLTISALQFFNGSFSLLTPLILFGFVTLTSLVDFSLTQKRMS